MAIFYFHLHLDFHNISDVLNIMKAIWGGGQKMETDKIPQWVLSLEPEDASFLKNFVLTSGSLKEIARLYGVSYSTVRLRLDKLIQKNRTQQS